MELVVAAVVVLIAVGILVASRGRQGRNGNDSPWWTFGLFALTSRSEEEAREEQIDALLAGEAVVDAQGSPDDRDEAAGGDDGGGDDDGGDGGDGGDGDGGDGGADD